MSGLDEMMDRIEVKVDRAMFITAWRRGQKLREQVTELMSDFFITLSNIGIDVAGPPDLGRYTPAWKPLSQSWIDRKGGDENFYFDEGKLQEDLLRRKPQRLFGRPVVWLAYNGSSAIKVNAGPPPAKYNLGRVTREYELIYTPYPRVQDFEDVEMIFGDESMIRYKLSNYKGGKDRPLLTPFAQWYLHIFLKRKIK